MDVIGKKYFYFLLSLIVIVPGLISLLLFGLNLSIDFTGGTLVTVSLPMKASQNDVNTLSTLLKKQGLEVSSVQTSGNLVNLRD